MPLTRWLSFSTQIHLHTEFLSILSVQWEKYRFGTVPSARMLDLTNSLHFNVEASTSIPFFSLSTNAIGRSISYESRKLDLFSINRCQWNKRENKNKTKVQDYPNIISNSLLNLTAGTKSWKFFAHSKTNQNISFSIVAVRFIYFFSQVIEATTTLIMRKIASAEKKI